MNILQKVTWKAMWKNRTRTIVTIIGIILSAAMFTAVTTMGISMWHFLVRSEIHANGDYFVQYAYASDGETDCIRQEEAVTAFADYQALGFLKTQEDSNGPLSTFVLAAADETFFDTMPVHTVEGRHPENSAEIVLPKCILDILDYYGLGTAIGDTITMELITEYDAYPNDMVINTEKKPFTKTYTIVGYILESVYQDYDLNLYSMLTFSDGSQGEALWHRVFVKSAPHNALNLYDSEYGFSRLLNTPLLGLHGVTRYSNYNLLLLTLAAVLCGIIMVGSVSLIYNAFSISVSERTKQFGLLISVGATRKQLRGAFYAEAIILCAIGIPPGLAAGFSGIALTLHLLGGRMDTFILGGNGAVTLRAVLSPAALLAAAAIALVTVLISAAIPARRATKISPLDAIRQRSDYRIPSKEMKVGRFTARLFGLPGMLAKKYYRVSRKKYRATVFSLSISVFLLISAASVTDNLRDTANRAIITENFDIRCLGPRYTLEELRTQNFVSHSAYVTDQHFLASTPDEMLSEDFLGYWEPLSAHYESWDKNMTNIHVYYLEDDVLRDYLEEHHIPAEPYFDTGSPTALVCAKEITLYDWTASDGNAQRHTYAYEPFREDAGTLQLLSDGLPTELDIPLESGVEGGTSFAYTSNDQGQPILSVVPFTITEEGYAGEDWSKAVSYLIRYEIADTGETTASYFLYNKETGITAPEPELVTTMHTPRVRLGETVRDLPYGISSIAADSYAYTCLIMPLSMAPAELREDANLCFDVTDYHAAIAWLNGKMEQTDYRNYKQSEENNRTLLLIINVFSYGFISLISLICVANVFNTISTNVALRRRDFGMLRSTGFRERDLWKMMQCECLIYGFRSLLWGLPLGMGVCYLIYRVGSRTYTAPFAPPWTAFLTAIVCVFAVVSATMFYALRKLRAEDPIDAIRMENT